MDIKDRVNKVRRTVMSSLTKRMRFTDILIKEENLPTVRRILVSRPNSRLGNQLMVTSLIQELITLFPDSKIDLFVRGFLSTFIFENYPQVDRIIRLPKKPFKELFSYLRVWLSLRRRTYDLVINAVGGSSSGRLSTRFAHAKWRLFNEADSTLAARYPDYRQMAKFPVYNFRHYISRSGITLPERPVPTLNIKLSPAELENGKKVMDSYVDPSKRTICFYTFATGMKCYSKEWWAVMYQKLKEAYGATYNLLEVLPVENISQIDFDAPAYYSKDIREIASVIAHAELYLGADCGITHLAAASGVPVVGLFSVTDISIYHPYGSHSVAIDTNVTSADGIIAAMNKILSECCESAG